MNRGVRTVSILLAIACAITRSTGQETPAPGHDPARFGKPLSYERIAGVGPCIAAEVAGDRLYAIGQGTFYALDIAQPLKPRLLGKLSGLGTTRQLFLKGSIAYVTARQDGLWLIDVSDPAQPALVSHYDTVEMATGIWISGNVGFVATRCYGVEIIDVSDPRHVRHLSTLKTGEAQSCWARDGLLYIGDWAPKKLLVADVRNPRQPVIVGAAELDGFGDGGCLRGNYCFAATGHHARTARKEDGEGRGHGLEIIDVSRPDQPVPVSRVKFPVHYSIFNDMWSARVAGDFCVAADTNNGLFIVDVHDVAKPQIVAHAQLPHVASKQMFDPVGGVALGQGVIYAAGIHTGLYLIPADGLVTPVIPEPDQPPVLGPAPEAAAGDAAFAAYRPDGQVQAVAIRDGVAWAACGAAGIHAVKLGEALTPVAFQPGKGDVSYVAVSGERLVAAEGKAGLAVYEIEAGSKLRELGRLALPGQGVKQAVAPAPGRWALFHCGGATAHIADLADPAHPALALSDSQVGLFYGDQLVDHLFGGRYLVAYWQRSGPAWYDVAGPKPVLAGNTPDTSLYSWTDGACARGEQLLLVKKGKLMLLNAREPRNASDLPSSGVNELRLVGRPSVSGNTLVLSSRHERRVWVLDMADWDHPRLDRQYELTGHPGACAVWNGRVVIPAGYQGLLMERQPER